MKKEGHRVYLLTGSRYDNRPYQKVFEKYNFSYDSTCLNEIFESIRPDLTIYMGAYDTNFNWDKSDEEAVKYSARMMNILMAYVMAGSGRFVYLSSSEVYSGDYKEEITVVFSKMYKYNSNLYLFSTYFFSERFLHNKVSSFLIKSFFRHLVFRIQFSNSYITIFLSP